MSSEDVPTLHTSTEPRAEPTNPRSKINRAESGFNKRTLSTPPTRGPLLFFWHLLGFLGSPLQLPITLTPSNLDFKGSLVGLPEIGSQAAR